MTKIKVMEPLRLFGSMRFRGGDQTPMKEAFALKARLKAEVAKVEAARQARSDSMGGAKGAQTAVRESFKELLGTQEVCEGRSNRWLLPSHSPGCC